MEQVPAVEDTTLNLPRILCLHGGGTNAAIFESQCRGIIAQLKHEFRLVFADAPFTSRAGPDVMAVYHEWGPFRRWLRWQSQNPNLPAEEIVQSIDQSLLDAMRQDDERGATGEWAALLGFSQGAKLSASLLYRQQVRNALPTRNHTAQIPNFRFGVLLAGRAPLISLDQSIKLIPELPDASQITDFRSHLPMHTGNMLRIPTIHIHGLLDPGLELHRELFHEFCHPDSRRLLEWDGAHRLPLKLGDVSLVVHQIRELANESGVQ